jgi:hypothetical protein
MHDYPYTYLALDDLTALAETLLRGLSFRSPRRPVPWVKVSGRELVLLETTATLRLISLVSAADLAAAWQDTWLVHTEASDYGLTRCWGHWLRDSAPATDGLIWRSKRQPDGLAVLLFGDRDAAACLTSGPYPPRALDDPAGLEWLNRRLSLLNTYVAAPASPASTAAAQSDG